MELPDYPPHVPELVWEQIRDLGGRNAVQRLVLRMLGDLADAWAREDEITKRQCAAAMHERLHLLDNLAYVRAETERLAEQARDAG